jgi:hypothetical protein
MGHGHVAGTTFGIKIKQEKKRKGVEFLKGITPFLPFSCLILRSRMQCDGERRCYSALPAHEPHLAVEPRSGQRHR